MSLPDARGDLPSLDLLESRFRGAIAASLDAFFLLEAVRDADGGVVDFRIVELNDRADELFGSTRIDLIGRLASDVLPSLRTSGMLERFIHVVETGQGYEDEHELRGGECADRWIRHQVVRVDDGLAITSRDITRQKHVELALVESEARYRHLVECASDGIYRIDPRGVFSYANPMASRLLGFQEGEPGIIGRSYLEFVRKDYQEQGIALYMRQIAERIPVTYWEFPATAVNGNELWIGQNVHIEQENGQVTSLFAVARDITERRRVEEELRQAQKMEAVGQLAGGVAHDFNNLLTSIRGFSDLLARSINPDDPRRKDIGEILKATERAAELTRQLLAFSKRQVLRLESVSLNGVVEDMSKIVRRLLGERIEVQLKLDADLWTVRADVGQLEHALLNLALNARDAMPHGGALRITTRNEDVQPGPLVDGVLPAGRYAVLELTDNGIGMSEETRSRVFEPFFTTKDPADRSGLGLATVYGIVNQASGRISVASRPGNGTTFTIHLPAAPDFDGDAAADGSRSGSSTGNVILIAEDNEGVRALTVRVLTSAGYQVVEGCDGVDALETLRARGEPVDLLISDVMMPRMNGAELAARFQRIQPGTPIMLMSGYMDDEAVRRAFDEPDAILPKPFTPDALISRVKELIGKRASVSS